MYYEQTMQVKERHSKGTVAIIISNDRLQLRFNYGGKRHYLSLGLSDTQDWTHDTQQVCAVHSSD